MNGYGYSVSNTVPIGFEFMVQSYLMHALQISVDLTERTTNNKLDHQNIRVIITAHSHRMFIPNRTHKRTQNLTPNGGIYLGHAVEHVT